MIEGEMTADALKQVTTKLTPKPSEKLSYRDLSNNPLISITWSVGFSIGDLIPSSTGTPITSYTVTPALPPGLQLDGGTGKLSGTPTAVAARKHYTIAGSNAAGRTSTVIQIEVVIDNLGTRTFAYPTPSLLMVGKQASIPPPVGANYSAPIIGVTYSVSPALPAGLKLNPTSGSISGTPTSSKPAAIYSVTMKNSLSASQIPLLLAVVSGMGSAVSPTESKIDYGWNRLLRLRIAEDKRGKAIIVNAESPAHTTNYSVATDPGLCLPGFSCSGTLPVGLTLDPNTGRIEGSALLASSLRQYTIKATSDVGTVYGRIFIEVTRPTPEVVVYGYHYQYSVSGGTLGGTGMDKRYDVGTSAIANAQTSVSYPSGSFPELKYSLVNVSTSARIRLYRQATEACNLPIVSCSGAMPVTFASYPPLPNFTMYYLQPGTSCHSNLPQTKSNRIIGYACNSPATNAIKFSWPLLYGGDPSDYTTPPWVMWVFPARGSSSRVFSIYTSPADPGGESTLGTIVSADVKWGAGKSPGLVTHYNGPGETNFYVGSANALTGRFEVYRMLDRTAMLLGAAPLPSGVTGGNLSLTVIDYELILSFNNNAVIRVSDGTFRSGKTGIRGEGIWSNFQMRIAGEE